MGRHALAIALLVATGCRQLLGFDDPGVLVGDGAPPTDSDPPGDISMELMPVDGCTSFSTVINTCATTANGDVSISSAATYNTSTFILDIGGVTSTPQHVVFQTATGEIDALFATSFTLTATLRIVGSRPFAIVSTGGIILTASGTLDVSAGGAGVRGATACTGEVGGPGNADINGGSGGGGAGYQAGGGAGGNGDSDNGQSIGGTAGGGRSRPVGLLGGCPGGRGGAGDALGGIGGDGAGAMLLTAATSIMISGVVIAGGGGGVGGGGDGGGGGGGAGGMIVLESPSVTVPGAITANGGGGGEGGQTPLIGSTGAPGNATGGSASGGSGGASGGADGGLGSGNSQTTGGSPSSVQVGGGGGGGGAAGYIAIGAGSTTISGVVSPVAGVWP